MGMFFVHPAYVASSMLLSCAYYISICGRKAFRTIAGLLVLFVLLSVLNPLLNTYGERVLFTYFNGRPYTLEALFYGVATSGMVVSVLLWFCSYNAVMTSDKFLYIFGRFAPAISLLLTMVLRLVPSYERKVSQIASARKCIGKAGDSGEKKELINNGLTVLGSLTSWALEGAIVTADSMRSRGYGCGKRTAFSVYSFGAADKLLAIIMLLLIICVVVCAAMGATYVTYTPVMNITPINTVNSVAGIISYIAFLSIPTFLNIKETIVWSVLIKRI